jgi:hypothetical protein
MDFVRENLMNFVIYKRELLKEVAIWICYRIALTSILFLYMKCYV